MKELLGPTWIEIDLDAIKQNIKNIRKLIGEQVKIMGIVKGNAYGHDSIEVAKILINNGVEYLAVARIEEAIILRKNNVKVPILVLGVSPEEQLYLYIDYDIMPTICDPETAEQYNKIAIKKNKNVLVHLKIETGMGRLGIFPQKAINVIKQIIKLDCIDIQGVYTHFSTADEVDKQYTGSQLQIFNEVISKIKSSNIPKIPFFHMANSAAILELPETWLDIVRPGCIIYGLYPSKEVKKTIQLKSALSFKSRISFIKRFEIDKFIGYGRTYKTKKSTLVATIPVGYADGYSRLLSNQGKVLVNGIKVPVIGRVCMDQLMIDVTDIENVEVGSEVVLWGEQMGDIIEIERTAELLNTIVDEVVHLTDKSRVAKLFIRNEKPWKIKNILGEYKIAE
ncbi:MAG: alanine racemase [Atribacterota bacterium]|nr:alanine racemase [Atribacterota bacterium]MDD3641030.1 alanine racemase [Atribacterota bacterium]